MQDLAVTLEERMRSIGTSRIALARMVGCSPATVGNWLNHHDAPRPKWCAAIADYLGWPLEDVLRLSGHIPANGNGHGDPHASAKEKALANLVAYCRGLDLPTIEAVERSARVLSELQLRLVGTPSPGA